MAVQAWFDRDDLDVEPGTVGALTLTVEHLGRQFETYAVTPTGPATAWTVVTRPTIVIGPDGSDTVTVEVHPPRAPTTGSGPTSVTVRVVPIPSGDSDAPLDDGTLAEATVHVRPFDDRRVNVLQPAQRARRRATFELLVENRGNELASCRLHLVDPTGRVDGSFDPPAVGVPPGAVSLVRLRARATDRRLRRSERQLEFEIEAAQPGHRPALAPATIVQPATIPGRWLVRTAAAGAAVAVAVAAWVGVIRPELRDAADRAVDSRLAELEDRSVTRPPADPSVSTVPTGVDEAVVTTTPSPDVEPVDAEPFVTRLQVRPGPGGTSAEDVTPPAGARLEVSDVVLQNRSADVGTASLLLDDQVLYEWDLAVMGQPNEFQPRLTPIPVEPGQRLAFRVTCEVVGDPTVGTCDVAVLLGGRIVTPSPAS